MEESITCWRCGSTNIVRKGHGRDGRKRQYLCRQCHHYFVVPQTVMRYKSGEPHCRRCNVPLTLDNWYASDNRRKNWICVPCHKRTGCQWRVRIDYNRHLAARLRDEVMKHYGSKCACCGESSIEFLTLDHVNDDGATHRRAMNRGKNKSFGGWRLYRWLKSHNYPNEIELQILCWNCNEAKRFYEVCPHQKRDGRMLVPLPAG